MSDELKQRKENLFKLIKENEKYIIYSILAFIIGIGFWIRTRNLPLLKDITTGKYIPMELDSFVYLKYAQYILEHGKLYAIDMMRYFPLGANMSQENVFLSYFIVYLYKFIHILIPNVTLELIDILYPPIAFGIATIFFFLLIRRLFNARVALLSCAFLTVIPTFLPRTVTGFSDKEAFGILLMFIAFYFYVVAWQSKKINYNIIFGSLAGIFTGLMSLAWGGVVYVTMTLSFLTLVELFLNKFEKKDSYIYASWFIFTIFIMSFFTGKYGGISGLIHAPTYSMLFFTMLIVIIDFLLIKHDLFKVREKIEKKMPPGIFSLLIALILTIIGIIIISDLGLLLQQIKYLFLKMIGSMSIETRFGLTVQESARPYISTWISDVGWIFTILFILGSIILFYDMIKHIKHKTKLFTFLYGVTIFSFIFARYSSNSILNGDTFLSNLLFLIIPSLFILTMIYIYIKTFYKDKESFKEIVNTDKKYILIFILFILMSITALSAVRNVFTLSIIISFLGSYALYRGFEIAYASKDKLVKYTLIALILILLFAPFINGSLVNDTQDVYTQAKYTGPGYNQQWQLGMDWVRKNTPTDTVFAHWWDYGYWVQGGGERATVTDGGNWISVWNYFLGRHLLTAQNETEALEFLKTHNVSYVLIISDEIGKYGAYSSIGSDTNYDRLSQIGTFTLEPTATQETRNETLYVYTGGFPFDDDFIYKGTLLPRGKAVIAGIILPTKSDNNSLTIGQPIAATFYQNKRYDLSVQCVYFNGQEIDFPTYDIGGCFRIVPQIQSNGQGNLIGGGFYLSEKVRRTLFGQLYLLNKKWSNFTEVYNDQDKWPLAFYRNTPIGPMKIWKVTYPPDIKPNDKYLSTTFPNRQIQYTEG
ncbi:MAG: glycosyltransferase family 39 protein [Candidatus Woesearchaeota archaeon]|nr:glycosyltransferase family 39 protein [Candidatus Woesearchaeota archaeon]